MIKAIKSTIRWNTKRFNITLKYQSFSSYICSIDQGTSSTRCILFNKAGEIIGSHQREHTQYYPHRGYVEHNPDQIWENTLHVIDETLRQAKITEKDIVGIGITNQRETTVVWNRYCIIDLKFIICRHTGKAYHNAIVWNDTRTHDICEKLAEQGGKDRFRETTGLPISPYFSASKLKYLLEQIPNLRRDAENGDALFGTIDTYLIWKLTAGNGNNL